MKDGDANEDDQQDSHSPEKDLHRPEKFFLTLSSLCQSKKDKFENKAAGCHGLVGDIEVIHSSSVN